MLFLLVLNAEDNSPPGDLTVFFLNVINQLHETMPSYAELVFHMTCLVCQVLLTGGSKLITPDYYWLWVFCIPTAPDIGMYNLLRQYFVYRRGYPYVKRIPSCKFYPYVNTMSMRSNNILILRFF